MDCQLTRGLLVAYHYGSVSPAERTALEAHLLECPGCLKGFLALKRELETAESGPRPSVAARERLRRAVAREISSTAGREPSWWRRPLAFGFAAAATAATMLAVVSVRGQLGLMAQLASEQPAGVEVPAQRR